MLVPMGFICDNAEVLYDLDEEAAGVAKEVGIGYFRARTVLDHPKMVTMFTEFIKHV